MNSRMQVQLFGIIIGTNCERIIKRFFKFTVIYQTRVAITQLMQFSSTYWFRPAGISWPTMMVTKIKYILVFFRLNLPRNTWHSIDTTWEMLVRFLFFNRFRIEIAGNNVNQNQRYYCHNRCTHGSSKIVFLNK